MHTAHPVGRVAVIARRLLDDGHVQYEVDAWRTAMQLLAAHDAIARDRSGAHHATVPDHRGRLRSVAPGSGQPAHAT